MVKTVHKLNLMNSFAGVNPIIGGLKGLKDLNET